MFYNKLKFNNNFINMRTNNFQSMDTKNFSMYLKKIKPYKDTIKNFPKNETKM